MKKNRKKLTLKITFFILFIVIISLFALWLFNTYNLGTFTDINIFMRSLISQNIFLSLPIIALIIIIFSNSPFPISTPLQIIIGFLFGMCYGGLFNLISSFLAALLGFAMSRFLLRDYFKRVFAKKLPKFEKEIKKNGFYYIIGARIFPIIPYFITNYLSGLTNISFRKYAISSFIGMIPIAFIYGYLGDTLQHTNSLESLMSVEVIIISIVLALLSQMPVICKKYKRCKN